MNVHGDKPARTTKDAVLDLLLTAPQPLDAAAVGERLGLHVTTARFHLEQLELQGLVRRRAATERRRGRPRILYSPAAAARADGSREQLIEVLARALSREADAGAESVRAGALWADAVSADAGHEDDALSSLMHRLDELGFAPEAAREGIRLHACPFRDAAREHPDVVCAVHRGLVQRLAESARPARSVRLVPFVEPELCLVAFDPR